MKVQVSLVTRPMSHRIIIFRTDKLGDMIVSTSIIRAIKAKNPQAQIMVVASSYNVVSVAGHELIDQCLIYDKTAPLFAQFVAFQKIRAFKPTHTLVLSPKTHCYFLALLSGAKMRGGILMSYRWLPRLLAPLLLHKSVLIPKDRSGGHLSERLIKLGRVMGLVDEGIYPYLVAEQPAAALRMAKQIKERVGDTPYMAVHLCDKWVEEKWQADDVKKFLLKAQEQTGLKVVATAGPVDKKLSEALGGTFPLFKNLTFHEWVAVMKGAQLVISPDCAGVHIACALQKPLLALYPATRALIAIAEFGPWGTRHVPRSLEAPEKQTHILLSDLDSLLETP